MTAIDERITTAWRSDDPTALDSTAEQLAADGHPESAISDALERLLLAERAAGADDATEEQINGVMDRLTGWCHESRQIRSRRSDIPSEEEIANLPRWARVAFAARCARRVLPLFRSVWHEAVDEDWDKIARAIGSAEAAAAQGQSCADASAILTQSWASAKFMAEREKSPKVSVIVANAARIAVSSSTMVGYQDPYSSVAASYARTAIRSAVPGAETLSSQLIRRDFDRLIELAETQHWTDDTPVPPEVFGPLWPDGPPPEWPAEPELLAERIAEPSTTADGTP